MLILGTVFTTVVEFVVTKCLGRVWGFWRRKPRHHKHPKRPHERGK